MAGCHEICLNSPAVGYSGCRNSGPQCWEAIYRRFFVSTLKVRLLTTFLLAFMGTSIYVLGLLWSSLAVLGGVVSCWLLTVCSALKISMNSKLVVYTWYVLFSTWMCVLWALVLRILTVRYNEKQTCKRAQKHRHAE